ncbi:MAG: hypothetical protein EHM79_08130 [Geobacter sp.]|nr:MAG: hypothetical protein EHM79_08130 [Geobacter sp.]
MLIQVIYQKEKRFGAVHSSRLASLIHSGQLFAFRRAHEWVVVENDPVRGVGGSYSGPERRNAIPCIGNAYLSAGDEDGQDTATNLKADSSESECMKILESYNKF